MLDGKPIDLANYLAEPPGLFLGRGAHPLRGSWKPRVTPQDVTLNVDESIKELTTRFGKYGDIAHDHESIWVPGGSTSSPRRRSTSGPHKSSDIQQSRNREKYDKAKKIGEKLSDLQKEIRNKLSSRDQKEREVASVCYP